VKFIKKDLGYKDMTIQFIDLEEAKREKGNVLVVVSRVPSPWSEGAKGIFHMKEIDFKCVRLVHGSKAFSDWSGFHNAPVLRSSEGQFMATWNDLLLFAEKINPEASLIPDSPFQRAQSFGFLHELMGQDGLCWNRRLQLVHAGKQLNGEAKAHADFVGMKYGYNPEKMTRGHQRICELLAMFSGLLQTQYAKGNKYYFGDSPSALDVYSATSMALFSPLPESDCAMDPQTRLAFGSLDQATRAALDPILLEHRDRMYDVHLTCPVEL
jgi:glutathione S-transferase